MKGFSEWARTRGLAALVMAAGLVATGCDDDDGEGGSTGRLDVCADAGQEPALGTLAVQSGFRTCGRVPLPAGILALAAVPADGGFALYGVDRTTEGVHALGTWPSLAQQPTALFRVTGTQDAGSAFLSEFLVSDGTRLLAGSTLGFTEGSVGVADLPSPAAATFVTAPGNFSAGAVPGAGFVVNGLGLGEQDAGLGLYGLRLDAGGAGTRLLAQAPPPPEGAIKASAPTAVTSRGVAVVGFSDVDPATFRSTVSLHAVAPAVLAGALQGGAAFALADQPRVFADGGLGSAAGLGEGVALDLGDFRPDFSRYTSTLAWVPVTLGDAGTVETGAPVPVLVSGDTCTGLVLMAPMGEDLLVGVEDRCADAGRSLVVLRKLP